MKTDRVDDPYNLARFIDAQRDSYERAFAELLRGRKSTHWMWFVFPQAAGLGHSAMSRFYALRSLDEARAYFAHPLLGARLLACTHAVNAVPGRTAHEIFGSPDDIKFQSCMTLFAAASPETPAFALALDKYGGGRDERTREALGI